MTLVEPEVAPEGPDVSAADIAAEIGNDGELKRKSKVRAFTPLPGVPEGTRGIVTLVNGWDVWVRYRVLFDNGVDLGSINREHLCPAKQYDALAAARAAAIASGVFDQPEVDETEADAAEAGGGGGGEGAVVNGVTVPQHLLERSKAARERLGA